MHHSKTKKHLRMELDVDLGGLLARLTRGWNLILSVVSLLVFLVWSLSPLVVTARAQQSRCDAGVSTPVCRRGAGLTL